MVWLWKRNFYNVPIYPLSYMYYNYIYIHAVFRPLASYVLNMGYIYAAKLLLVPSGLVFW